MSADVGGSRRALPFVLRLLCGRFCSFGNFFLYRVDDGIRIPPRGKHYLQLIPKPMTRGGKIEIMAFYGKTVRECDAPSGGMASVGPIAGFQQDGVKHSQLDNFAADAVDFHPVAEANAIFPHEHQPANEGYDEILECVGQARAAKPGTSSET